MKKWRKGEKNKTHLISEDIIVHVVLLGILRGEHKGLDKSPHGLTIVGQLPRDLHHYAISQRLVRVNL